MSFTFALIKPTAVEKKQVGFIISHIENTKFDILETKTLCLSDDQVGSLYAEHANQDFYNDLCQYMQSGPVVVIKLYYPCENAWKKWRNVIGETDPKNAADGTIRKRFGISRRENAIHGSDSAESAKRELEIFF